MSVLELHELGNRVGDDFAVGRPCEAEEFCDDPLARVHDEHAVHVVRRVQG
jgi:hypothetical protein